MADDVAELSNSARLADEVNSLRGENAQLRRQIEHLDELAHQDSLSELPNRRGFMRALERIIDRVKRYDEQSAMMFVDLDGLKMINDSFGHGAGDEALVQVSRMLVGGVRKSDIVARIGGDEFGILLAHCDEDSAHETAARLIDMIADCDFFHDGQLLPLSVAIGVGMIGGDDTPAEAMARADAEMYRRKAA